MRATIFSQMKMAKNIRLAREAKHMTKAEVARTAGLVYTTYDSYERGDRCPPIGAIMRIGEAVGVKWYELIEGLKTE